MHWDSRKRKDGACGRFWLRRFTWETSLSKSAGKTMRAKSWNQLGMLQREREGEGRGEKGEGSVIGVMTLGEGVRGGVERRARVHKRVTNLFVQLQPCCCGIQFIVSRLGNTEEGSDIKEDGGMSSIFIIHLLSIIIH